MKIAVFSFENEYKMNVLSQDDAFGNSVYNYTGCGTPAHWHLGLETMILSTANIKKEKAKWLLGLLVEL